LVRLPHQTALSQTCLPRTPEPAGDAFASSVRSGGLGASTDDLGSALSVVT
jgi:hypothetical protein